jgi:hypothetical protein
MHRSEIILDRDDHVRRGRDFPHELDYENLAAAYWRPGKARWRPYLHSLNIEARLADLRKEVGALPREPCVR